jgi:hypothetical protein
MNFQLMTCHAAVLYYRSIPFRLLRLRGDTKNQIVGPNHRNRMRTPNRCLIQDREIGKASGLTSIVVPHWLSQDVLELHVCAGCEQALAGLDDSFSGYVFRGLRQGAGASGDFIRFGGGRGLCACAVRDLFHILVHFSGITLVCCPACHRMNHAA